MEKDKENKKTKLSKPKSSVINTNPQLPGVNEQGSAVAKDPIIEKVLSLSQRRQRALTMRKNKTKIARAKEMARTRFAPDIRLKKRSQELARNIVRRKFAGERGMEYATLSPSDKINVDKLIDKKVALIKKIAERIFPRVKKAETQRLAGVRSGQKVVQQGGLGRSNLFQSVEISLHNKSNKSGIPFEIVSEVFVRGYNAWTPNMTHTAEQNAFNRVNSYISGGKARELDSDLIEKEVWDKPNPVQKAGKSSKLSPGAKAKAKARASAAGRPYPNMVDNIWAARNEEVLGEAQKSKSMFSDEQHAEFAKMPPDKRKERLSNIRKLTTHSDKLTRTNAVSAYREFKQKYASEEAEQVNEYGPTNWQITQAANKADKALDKKYGYGTTKGGISPIAGRRRQQGFGAQANFDSAQRSLSTPGNLRTKADAIHRGWSKTVKNMPAADEKKQASREKLKKTPFFKLSRDEQKKDEVVAKAVKESIDTKPKLKDKTVKREIASIPQKSMDPMSEQACSSKRPLLSKIKKMVKK